MIYLYDNAIVKDLEDSFNPNHVDNPLVRVIDPEMAIGLAAQLQNDEIKFPIIAVTRSPEVSTDTDRMNFTRLHRGSVAVIDNKTNNLYYEKAIPIQLSYALTVITTRVSDMDEIIKELLFKYTSEYFITITLPYECNRKIRFGMVIDSNAQIETRSSAKDYYAQGKLYETVIPIRCDGCVLVSYTPVQLRRTTYEIAIDQQNT